MYYQMFPEVVQALQEEIQKHQGLMYNLLQLPKDSPMELKLGEIAAYCGVVLDGVYTEQEVLELMEKCLHELRKARVELVTDILGSSKEIAATDTKIIVQ